jgi:putative ABC transport system permease protein
MSSGTEPRSIERAAGLYRASLALLPRDMRTGVGDEMAETFREICQDAHRRSGVSGVLWVTAVAEADLGRRLWPEWRDSGLLGRASKGSRRERRGRMSAMVDAIRQDLRDGLRSLARTPGYTVMVALIFALALGANAAVFSVIDAVTLKPLPYDQPDRIVTFAEMNPGIDIPPRWASIPNFIDWRAQTTTFETLALFRGRTRTITGGVEPVSIYSIAATASFFEVFGVRPFAGRVFGPDENRPGSARSVVLAHALWQEHYGGDLSVIGRTIRLDGDPYTVVGVMPRGFDAPADWLGVGTDVALWLPFGLDAAAEDRASRSYHVAGRLAPGVSLDAARADVKVITNRLARAYPAANAHWSTMVLPWRDVIVGRTGRALALLWGLVLVVLLIAAANVAGLTLQRVWSRQGEMAVRAALGAGRVRLVRQIMLECLILAAVAAGLGLMGASWLLGVVRGLGAEVMPMTDAVQLDGRALGVTLAMTVAVALAASLWPALTSGRADPIGAMKAAPSRHLASRQRGRAGIVTAQLALAYALVTVAAVLVASFAKLLAVPAGLAPERVFTATLALSWDRVDSLDGRTAFVSAVLDRLRALPGVESAAMINSLPFTDSNQYQPVGIDGRPAPQPGTADVAAIRGISADYFRTLGIPLFRGRDFDESDLSGGSRTMIVNRLLADRYWPGGDPIGKRVSVGSGPPATVVGVVADVRHYGLDKPVRPEVYLPYNRDTLTSKSFVLRTTIDAATLERTVRRVILDVDPDQPVRTVTTMEGLINRSVVGRRLAVVTAGLAASIAGLLAFAGLFGTVAYAVTMRSREFGIRMALGAAPAEIRRLVLGWAGILSVTGLALGAVMSWFASDAVRAFVFGVEVHDPRVHVLVVLVFAVLTLAASYLPALQASRIEANEILRES